MTMPATWERLQSQMAGNDEAIWPEPTHGGGRSYFPRV
jgi:hypothetical protein